MPQVTGSSSGSNWLLGARLYFLETIYLLFEVKLIIRSKLPGVVGRRCPRAASPASDSQVAWQAQGPCARAAAGCVE